MKRTILGVLLAGFILPANLLADSKPQKKNLLGLSGWVVFNDPGNASLVDFEKHASQIDRAYFDWYLVGPDGMPTLKPGITQALKDRAIAAARQGQCQPWFRISNLPHAGSDVGVHTEP